MYQFELIKPWLWKLNTLKLRFLYADEVEDIAKAFEKLDESGDGKISIDELSNMCGSGIARYWAYKYGKDYQVHRAL